GGGDEHFEERESVRASHWVTTLSTRGKPVMGSRCTVRWAWRRLPNWMEMPGTVAPGMKRMRRGWAGSAFSWAGRTASMATPSGMLSWRVRPGSLEYRASRPSWAKTTSSMGCWRRSARVTAALRKAATESLAETMRTLSRPAEAAGRLRPTMRAMIATTTTISTRVTPRVAAFLRDGRFKRECVFPAETQRRRDKRREDRERGREGRLVKPKRCSAAELVGRTPWSARDALVPLFARRIKPLRHGGRPTRASAADQGVRPTRAWSLIRTRRELFVLPADDVGIDPFAAGAEADDFGLVDLMLAREAVDEVAGPGVLGDVLGHVGAVPLVDIGGLDAQRLEPLFGGGEGAGIELVSAQGGHEIIDLGAGDGDLRLIRPPEQSGSDEGYEEPDDGYHHQHFDEGDTGLTGAFSIAFRSLSHGYIATSLMLVIASSMLRIRAPIRMPITRMTTGILIGALILS